MNITIVGGGNIGTQFAVHCANKQHNVTIFTSREKDFNKKLNIVNDLGNTVMQAEIDLVTSDCSEAFSLADVVFVTVPFFAMQKSAKKMYSFIKQNATIVLVPGGGGSECAFIEFVNKGCTLVGMQRVPSVARLVKYGETVRATGYRSKLHIATIPNSKSEYCANMIESIFDIPCECLPNYLNVSMIPSNPILHTTRLYTMFKDYSCERVYEKNPLFYEEWDIDSAKLLLECDAEVQKICKSLDFCDTSNVRSLREHYESNTPEELVKKLHSINSLKGILSPMVKVENGYVPDFSSRYFSADFSFGLKFMLDVAKLFNVDVPYMDMVYDWYIKVSKNKEVFSLECFNITTKEDFIKFYNH